MPSHESSLHISRLPALPSEQDLAELTSLLIQTVNGGGSVSFLAPLAEETARSWWLRVLGERSDRCIVLVAREHDRIVGTVQCQPAWAPNQPHRADIAKMMVHPDARGRGIGRLLLERIEQDAQSMGFRLLVLDTKRGTAAEQLYESKGWTRVGGIPDFALDPDGAALHETVIFYKRLPPVID